jgi:DNA helicase IV
VLGDLAQGTTPWATADWADLLGHLGKPTAELRVLRTGYRVPRQILDYASQLLSRIAPGLSAAVSLREDPDALQVLAVPADRLAGQLAAVCAAAASQPGSTAVIAADQQVPELSRALGGLPHTVLGEPAPEEPAPGERGAGEPTAGGQLSLVPVTMAKGLEFDHVIVVEPAAIARAEARGLSRLYVALTRAVSRLTVLHTEPLPAPLAGPLADPAA